MKAGSLDMAERQESRHEAVKKIKLAFDKGKVIIKPYMTSQRLSLRLWATKNRVGRTKL